MRISSLNNKQRFLLLAVNGKKLVGDSSKGIILFNADDERETDPARMGMPELHAGTRVRLSEARGRKITGDTGQPVLAVDPAADKLPDTLSANDMKAVTLWLLQPERITSDKHGIGLKASVYEKRLSNGTMPKWLRTLQRPSQLRPNQLRSNQRRLNRRQ